jgi:ribosomal protein RSM22 (predicted rRNA methylase)
MIPEALQLAIVEESSKFSLKELLEARVRLTGNYREVGTTSLHLKDVERCAYLISRLPATYGVVSLILEEWEERFPSAGLKTFLDVGAGPGSASWAVLEKFPSIEKGVLLEKERGWIDWGKKLAAKSPLFKKTEWLCEDISQCRFPSNVDLVVCSYSLGELPLEALVEVLEKLWSKTEKALLIIEPGTPRGFEKIKIMRNILIQQGAYLAAPCPHANRCPLLERDWCHFPSRIPRSSLHRQLKEGQLSFEDEKFSYLLFTRFLPSNAFSRILRTPGKHSGHVDFTLCTSTGIQKKVVSKKSKEVYKAARKLEWGQIFP